jgi:hypothetical protein
VFFGLFCKRNGKVILLILLYFYTRMRIKRERSVILGVLLFFSVQMPALGWWCRVDWGSAHGIIVRVLWLIIGKTAENFRLIQLRRNGLLGRLQGDWPLPYEPSQAGLPRAACHPVEAIHGAGNARNPSNSGGILSSVRAAAIPPHLFHSSG